MRSKGSSRSIIVLGIVLAGIFLTIPHTASAAPMYVQSAEAAASSASTLSQTFASNVSQGSLIVVGVRVGGTGRTVTVSDNLNGSYSLAVTQTQGADHQAYIFYKENAAAGATTVTVTISGSGTLRFNIHEYAGAAASGALDSTSSQTGTGSAPDSGAISTSQADELVFGLATNNNVSSGSWTPATSGGTWTKRQEQTAVGCTSTRCIMSSDIIASSAGSYRHNPTFSTSVDWTSLVAAFKGSTGGAAPAPAAVNGVCGASLNSCSAGAFSDQPDSSTQYLWQCVGSGGGGTASCSANIPTSDTTPPVISSVSTGSITSTSATIAWTTDEASDTQVEYGLTSSYGSQTTLNTSLVISHSQSLSSLTPNTVYNYRVKSRDSAGNLSTSGNFTFTTAAAAPVTYSLTVSKSGTGSGTVSGGSINCGSTCAQSNVSNGTSITLVATPASGSVFTGWNGACSGTGACTVTITGNVTVSAGFNLAGSGTGNIIPSDRKIDWAGSARAGIPGGIPANRTKCVTVQCQALENAASGYKNGSLDARSLIQAAMNSAPANTYVYLPPGTYKIGDKIDMRSHVTLRGAGPDQTVISREGGFSRAALYFVGTQCPFQKSGCSGTTTFIPVTGGATKGSQTITVQTIPAGIGAGDLMQISQVNDGVLACHTISSTCSVEGSNSSSRGIGQTVEITSVSGNSVSFNIPLAWSYTNPALSPAVVFADSSTILRWAGAEDLKLVIPGNANFDSQFDVEFTGVQYSWLKNVELTDVYQRAVWFVEALQNEIRDSYIHGPALHSSPTCGRAYGYGIEIDDYSSSNLIENNAITGLDGGLIMLSTAATGNVIGYNYLYNACFDDAWWQTSSPSANHEPHPMMNLFEGNIGDKIESDIIHGSASHNTFFRGRSNGWQSDARTTRNNAIEFAAKNNYMNVVGYVLGTAGKSNKYQVKPGDPYNDTSDKVIWALGVASGRTDPATESTLLRWGNYDFVRNSFGWDDADNVEDPSEQNIPSSLYLSGKPSWFGSLAWPAFGPHPSSPSTLINGTIPAKHCREQGMMPNCLEAEGSPAPSSVYTLTVTKSGAGSGTITGGSINCGSLCTQSSITSGTAITLTASPASGSIFAGWSGGGCSGTGTCTIIVTSNTSVSATFNAPATPDTTPPAVSITSPTGGTVSGSIALSANASDNIGVVGVQFKLDGADLGVELTTPPYSGSWNTIGVSNGSHTLTAIARDAAGNARTSNPVSITVSNLSAPAPTPSPSPSPSPTPAPTPSPSLGGGGSSSETSSTPSPVGSFTPTVPQKPALMTQTSSSCIPSTTTSTSTYAFKELMSLGKVHGEVKILQQLLNSNGHTVSLSGPGSKGLETTYYGPATERAVKALQSRYKVTPTGSVGSITRLILSTLPFKTTTLTNCTLTTPAPVSTAKPTTLTPAYSITSALDLGSTGPEVAQLQTLLSSLPGIYPEKLITGVFGPRTQAAVQRFQLQHGLAKPGDPAYGFVGPATRAKLNSLK